MAHTWPVHHLTTQQLVEGLDHIRRSPTDHGRVELIVRRPDRDQREVVADASLDEAHGMLGDSWWSRTGGRAGPAQRDAQITLINARVAALVAGQPERRPLAGDQLYVDLDLSQENLPPGSRLEVGSAVVEISAVPHTGCNKFAARFGEDARAFVNSAEGRQLRLRGANARVVVAGSVRVGDTVRHQSQAVTG
jgi:hypothetical protein